MKRFAVAASALVFAIAAVVSAPEAEARRGGFGGGGFVLGALVGGLAIAALASRPRYRSYGYGGYGGGYGGYAPAYYGSSYGYGGGYGGYYPRHRWHRRHW